MLYIFSKFLKKNNVNNEDCKRITFENANISDCFYCKKAITDKIYYCCFNCTCRYHVSCKKNLAQKFIKYQSLNYTYKICAKCETIGSIFEKKIE